MDHSLMPILLCFFIKKLLALPLVASDITHPEGVLVRTVPAGENTVLTCGSNYEKFSFIYWHLIEKNSIIGPTNDYDISKFKYQILSGDLIIKAVSKLDEGLYACVSRAISGEQRNIRLVRMVVKTDWEDVYEHDYNINLIRVLIALITLVLLAMGGSVVYGMWKDRYKHPSYLRSTNVDEEEDDDSTEELFSQPSTSRSLVNNIVPGKPKSTPMEEEFDDVDISTDFNSILNTANSK